MTTKLHPIDRVLALMQAQGMSQRGLETLADLGTGTLSKAASKTGADRADALSLPTLRALAHTLGSSLSALLGLEGPAAASVVAAEQDPAVSLVPLALLRASLLNPRKTFDPAALEELADSIAAQGLLQNLVVRQAGEGAYEIVAGERRFRALEILVRRGTIAADYLVPVRIVTVDDGQHLAMALIENLQRRDMDPIDEANGFLQLQQLDPKAWSAKKIGAALGFSDRYVQQRIALVTKLPEEARQALAENKITVSQARVILQAPEGNKGDVLSRALREGGATVAELVGVASDDMVPVAYAIFDTRDCGLETTEIGEDQFFTDKKAFLKLQMKAARAKAIELRKNHHFAEVVEHFVSWEYPEADAFTNPKLVGVVLVVNPWDGEFSLHENRIRRPVPRAAGPMSPEAQKKAEDKEKEFERQRRAVMKANDQLRAALLADPINALRLALLDTLTEDPIFNALGEMPFDTAAAKEAGITRHLDGHTAKPGSLDAIWQQLKTLSPSALARVMGLALAASNPALCYSGSKELAPAAFIAAEVFGVELPKHLLPEQTDIETEAAKAGAKTTAKKRAA
ncbi:ParB/RepB/Spo0J family partition protein [Ferrovibrio sp.]|uniref:ParB/RepB/Spo0J family partition protein n=1 Tax=Ferrovibrio sp. TaxID=1917215 RepID=UPI003D1024EF